MEKKMLQKIKEFIFPSVDKEVQEKIDKECLNSMHILSIFIIAFEMATMVLFILTRNVFNAETWGSIIGVSFCVLACVFIMVMTGRMRKHNRVFHKRVALFEIILALVLSAWAIWASWRHYPADDQLLTFFVVQLLIVCFIPLKPWISIVMMIIIYSTLYVVLYSVDEAAGLNSFNYIMLVLVTIICMIIRFFSQKNLAEKTVLLQKRNDELEYANHHDALTGLRNRLALNEDAAGFSGTHIFVFMIDIDYFKLFNDNYGHSAGDTVLQETALRLQKLYPEGLCYRYGGDEFVVVCTQGMMYEEEIYQFDVPSIDNQTIQLCIGIQEGTPENYDQVFRMINNADRNMYFVKMKTHPDGSGR